MDKSIFAAMPTLTPTLGYASMIGLGLFSLALSYGVKTLLVRNTQIKSASASGTSNSAWDRSSLFGPGRWPS
jgi:hypothetical protein